MPYEKHLDTCLCGICTGSRRRDTVGTVARIMRAIMREWGVDLPSELPMAEALAAAAYAVGFYVEMGKWSVEAAHGLVKAGQQHARAGKPQTVPIDIVSQTEWNALEREKAKIEEQVRKNGG